MFSLNKRVRAGEGTARNGTGTVGNGTVTGTDGTVTGMERNEIITVRKMKNFLNLQQVYEEVV